MVPLHADGSTSHLPLNFAQYNQSNRRKLVIQISQLLFLHHQRYFLPFPSLLDTRCLPPSFPRGFLSLVIIDPCLPLPSLITSGTRGRVERNFTSAAYIILRLRACFGAIPSTFRVDEERRYQGPVPSPTPYSLLLSREHFTATGRDVLSTTYGRSPCGPWDILPPPSPLLLRSQNKFA